MFITYSSSDVDIYATSFTSNSGSSGNDIYISSGSVTIHDSCPAGYDGSNIVEGGSIDYSGSINGWKYSFSGSCLVCPEGK